LYDGEVHDYGDKNLDIIGRLKPSGIPQGATDKVPKEFAVHEAIEPGPYTIDAGGDGDKTSVLMPYKVAHCERRVRSTTKVREERVSLKICAVPRRTDWRRKRTEKEKTSFNYYAHTQLGGGKKRKSKLD